jgi:HlyD family secretion protein
MNKKTVWIIVILAVVVIVVCGFFLLGRGGNQVKYKTAAVARGDIETIVVTTGTLDPVTMVEVGSEVSGVIKNIYVD